MRCSEFEHQLWLAIDVRTADASVYQRFSHHAASCSSCNARLQEEQLLSRTFAEIGAQVRQISPSPEIEQQVMKAFDFQRQITWRHPRNWSGYAAAAIAAGLVLATVASLTLSRRQPVEISRNPEVKVDLRSAVAGLDVVPAPTPFHVKSKAGQRRPQSGNTDARRAAATEVPVEIATEFIRINDAVQIEPGAQIVRVRLPRSAMTQFGLPVNMDRADQPVKADVIMGIDGVAQAIRFVQ